jgi:hypothetical protein
MLPSNALAGFGALPGFFADGMAGSRGGPPQLLAPSISVMPPGWTTTPPQWRKMNERGGSAARDDAPYQPIWLSASPPHAVSDESSSDDDFDVALSPANGIGATRLTQDNLLHTWEERQALITNWKDETCTGVLPWDVFEAIVRKALESGETDDVRPELVFLRNLGAVCKSLAVAAEALRNAPEWSLLRGRAAAHEKAILDNVFDFEVEFKQRYLRKRWNLPALEDRYDMQRFGPHLRLDPKSRGVLWEDKPSSREMESYYSPSLQDSYGSAATPLVDLGKITLGKSYWETSSEIWMAFVRQHGDAITELCITSFAAHDEALEGEQFTLCRNLSRLAVTFALRQGGLRRRTNFNCLENLDELKDLDLSCGGALTVPNNVLARLSKLTVRADTLRSWIETGLCPRDWLVMEELKIIGDSSFLQWEELPLNLRRLHAVTTLLPDRLILPPALDALHLSLYNPEKVSGLVQMHTGLDALVELNILHSGPNINVATPLQNEDATALSSFLKSGTHRLQVLALNSSQDPEVNEALLAALASFDSLEKLELRSIQTNAKVYVALARIVTAQTRLRELTLYWNHKKGDGTEVLPLLDAIAKSPSLRSVSFHFIDGADFIDGKFRASMDDLLVKNRKLLRVLTFFENHPQQQELGANWLLRPEPGMTGNGNV